MKTSEFRKLIREEITKVLSENAIKMSYKPGDSVKDWEGNAVGKVLHAFKNGIELERALEKDKKLKTSIKWILSSASSLSDYLEQYEDFNNPQPHYIIKNGPKVYVLPQEDLE